jgi:predicted metal-dependent peptidase
MKLKNPGAYKQMRDARARLCFYKTYFGVALWALKFVEVEGLKEKAGGALAADKYWRVYYDPAFVETLSLKQLMALLLHELGHLIRNHHDRALAFGVQPINHMPWNIAGDQELNDDLEKDPEVDMKSISQPPISYDYVTPQKMGNPEGKTAEWYYQQLPEQKMPQCGNCGSGAHGQPQEWESEGSEGDEGAPDKIGKAEGQLIRKNVAEAIKNESKKSRSNVPGGWGRWAREFGKPQVDWRRELSALVRNRLAQVYGYHDYSYTKANRRQSLYGKIIMPTMVQPVPKIATVIDTSGSMSQKDLETCMTEIKGILTAVGIGEITNYVVDAEVHGGRRISSIADIELKGGGGTDMRVGISQAISEAKGDLDVVIVLTDGYTPWPSEQSRTHIIAVLTSDTRDSLPSFIKGVVVDTGETEDRW